MSGVESIPSSRGTRADVIFHHNCSLGQPLASVFRDVTDVFRDVTDPRDRRGVRHDPPTILCLGCDGDPATYITRSSRTTRRSPLAIRARTAVRLMDVAAAILGGRNVRRPHRIPPPSMTNASPPPDPEGYSGVVRVVLVGLVGLAGAGACPNLPQRRPAARSAANETAEYQRFSSGVPARFGSLWQIWTTGAAAGPVEGVRGRAGPAPGQRRDAARGVPEDFRPCAWAASESSGTRPGSAPRSTTRLRSSTKTTRGK